MADDSSSEGILGSSDDEIYDGLSEAVGHHIKEQEHATTRSPYHDVYRRGPSWDEGMKTKQSRLYHNDGIRRQFPVSDWDDRPSWIERQPEYNDRGTYEYDTDFDIRSDPHRRQPPYGGWNRPYSESMPRFSPPPERMTPPPLPFLATPMTEVQKFKEHDLYPPRTRMIFREYSPPPLEPPIHGGMRMLLGFMPPHGNAPVMPRNDPPYMMGDTQYPVQGKPMHFQDECVLESRENQNSERPGSSYDKASKTLPKPIMFQVKSSIPPKLPRHHPLDPLFSPPWNAEASGESPQKWSHDKFKEGGNGKEEGNGEKEINGKSENSDLVSNQKKSYTKHDEAFVTTNGNNNGSNDRQDHTGEGSMEDERNIRQRNNSKSRSQSKEKSSNQRTELQRDQPSSTVSREQKQVDKHKFSDLYEEEIIEEVVEVDSQTSEKEVLIEDEEDDVEILGLRLNALTSVMEKTQDEVASSERKKKGQRSKSKSKKSKPLLRRVRRSSKKTGNKASRGKQKSSSVSDLFMKKHSAIAKEKFRSSKEKIKSNIKPEKRLTLFGEIIKNQSKSTKDALRYIRSLPDSDKKTDMFLKLMKPKNVQKDAQSHKCRSETEQPGISEGKCESVPENAELDNYEEIEMDLDADEEQTSDTEICPPGTDDKPIILPLDSNDFRMKRHANEMNVLSPAQDSTFLANATPTQESIWNMLESPVRKQAMMNKQGVTEMAEESYPGNNVMNENVDTQQVRYENHPFYGEVEAQHEKNERKKKRILSEDIDDNALLLLRAVLLKQIHEKQERETCADDRDIHEVEIREEEESHSSAREGETATTPYPTSTAELQSTTSAPSMHSNPSQREKISPFVQMNPIFSMAADPQNKHNNVLSFPTEPTPSVIPSPAVVNSQQYSSALLTSQYPYQPPTLSLPQMPPFPPGSIRPFPEVPKVPHQPPAPLPIPPPPMSVTVTQPTIQSPQVFAPTHASTPLLPPSDISESQQKTSATNQGSKKTKRRRRQRRRSASRKSTAQKITELQKAGILQKPSSANKIKPPTTMVNTSKTDTPSAVSNSSGIKNPPSSVKAKPPTSLVSTPKTHTSSTVSNHSSASTDARVIFKSKTTLIKKVERPLKRSSPSLPVQEASRKVRLISLPTSHSSTNLMRLPRHQPVVINLQDSSDDEISETLAKSSQSQHSEDSNPGLRLSVLDEMIRQARLETDKAKTNPNPVKVTQKAAVSATLGDQLITEKNVLPSSQSEQDWPFSEQAEGSQSSFTSQDLEDTENKPSLQHSTKDATVNKKSPASQPSHSAALKQPVKDITKKISKNPIQKEKKPQTAKTPSSSGDQKNTFNKMKQTKIKFLKLKQLIQKEEMSMKRIEKIKDSKQSEMKVVQDELKEMVFRVKAIKGKASRCEKMLKHYSEQESKLKEKLEKRNSLKQKLEEQLKKEMLEARSENRKRLAEKAKKEQEKKVLEAAKKAEEKEKNQKLKIEKQRLLAVEQQLAAKISKMKKNDAAASGAAASSRRVSLSHEVQSHLQKYKQTVKAKNPSAHDLSLSKIVISPNRNHQVSSPSNRPSPQRNPSPMKNQHQQSEVAGKLETSKGENKKEKPVAKKDATPSKKESRNPSPMKNQHQQSEVAGKLETPKGGNKKEKPVAKKDATTSKKESKDTTPKKLSSADEKRRLQVRNALRNQMNNTKSLLLNLQEQHVEKSFPVKSWDTNISDCFKAWKINVAELIQTSKEESGRRLRTEFMPYRSPLHHFRSYRFNPFLRTKAKRSISSRTLSHKIDPERILCRYDLTGTCNDTQCTGQHLSDYELNERELMLDLLLYCPVLLGKKITLDTKQEDLVEMAEEACQNVCGFGRNKNPSMSSEQLCVLITDKINKALGNKAPFTTVFKTRVIRLQQKSRSDPVISVMEPGRNEDSVFILEEREDTFSNLKQDYEDPDSAIRDEERYFVDKNKSSLLSLEQGVKNNPEDVQLWLQLTNRRLRSGHPRNSLELALHTMCQALEENPYVGELWAHYLGLLASRKGADGDQDFEEMVSQALELVPLSTHVWKQLFSLKTSSVKREVFYDQLMVNLMKNVEDEDSQNQTPLTVTSHWLLQTVLKRTQLFILSRGPTMALQHLEMTVQQLSQQCRSASMFTKPTIKRCLTQTDLCNLWLAVINLKHFQTLPSAFLSSSSNTSPFLGMSVRPNAEIRLSFDSKKKMNEKLFADLHSDINNACAMASILNHRPFTTSSCVSLYRELLRLEISQNQWNSALKICQNLYESLSKTLSVRNWPSLFLSKKELHKHLTEVGITWADILVQTGETVKATQLFDSMLTECPSNAQWCCEAALFQLNLESKDVEAALLYFEILAGAFLNINKDSLQMFEIRKLFQYLLKLPTPLNEMFPPFNTNMGWEKVNQQKGYMWLIYCILMDLCGEPVDQVMECYEKGIIDVENVEEREKVWMRYLRYRLSLAPRSVDVGRSSAKSRQIWFRNFTAVVRRCLITCPTHFSLDDATSTSSQYAEYTFHNQVVSIYLSCLSTRQQISAAYSMFTDLMPHNIPLLLRACEHFLAFKDHASVISVLWKATCSSSCQNKTIWKISIAAHYARGRIAKAMRLCKRSLEALPYCRDLWEDYLNMLCAHGSVEELEAEKSKCHFFLQINPEILFKQPSVS